MFKFILTLLVILVLSGCQPTLKLLSGVKEPQYENNSSLQEYVSEQKIPVNMDENHFFTSIEGFLKLKKLRNDNLKLPDLIIFDKNGNFISDLERVCFPSGNYIDNLIENYQENSEFKLSLQDFAENLSGKKIVVNEETDYLVFIIWAKFGGKKVLNNGISDINEILSKSMYNIEKRYLNIDLRKEWED